MGSDVGGGNVWGLGAVGWGKCSKLANICPPNRKCLGRVRGKVWDLDIPGDVPHGPDILIQPNEFTEVL